MRLYNNSQRLNHKNIWSEQKHSVPISQMTKKVWRKDIFILDFSQKNSQQNTPSKNFFSFFISWVANTALFPLRFEYFLFFFFHYSSPAKSGRHWLPVRFSESEKRRLLRFTFWPYATYPNWLTAQSIHATQWNLVRPRHCEMNFSLFKSIFWPLLFQIITIKGGIID